MTTITTDCDHPFEKPVDWPPSIDGCTLDCPTCDQLLIMVSEMEARGFHQVLHERSLQNPEPSGFVWPADGKGTGVIELEES